MSFAENQSDLSDEFAGQANQRGELPRHGFQGNRAPPTAPTGIPASVTIAVSREAGSRGNTIGNRAGLKLGWPVYNQELLEYVAQETRLDTVPPNISTAQPRNGSKADFSSSFVTATLVSSQP